MVTMDKQPEKGVAYAIVDSDGAGVKTLRAGLSWDPAGAQPDTKGGNSPFGKARRKARKLLQGAPKSDLDNSVVFFAGTTTVRIANGSNQYPWRPSVVDFGPVRASKDSTGGVGFGLDEWTDIDLDKLPGAVDGFVVLASTFDKGNFSTALNVTGSLWNILPGAQEEPVAVGDEFYPEISDDELNVSIGGFGRRQHGLWQFTPVIFQGHLPQTDDVDVANKHIMAFAKEHLGHMMTGN